MNKTVEETFSFHSLIFSPPAALAAAAVAAAAAAAAAVYICTADDGQLQGERLSLLGSVPLAHKTYGVTRRVRIKRAPTGRYTAPHSGEKKKRERKTAADAMVQ